MNTYTPVPILQDRHILLGVTGSIAAYKSPDLASKLTQAGALVDVILTQAAEKFVSPVTFQSVTGRRAYTDADLWGQEAHILHVALAEEAELLVIAPATANTLAHLATGQAGSLLAIAALAARCPLVVAPAMDARMFEHPATQANLEILRQRGAIVAGPGEGRMASGLIGRGRMLEPTELVGYVRLALGRSGPARRPQADRHCRRHRRSHRPRARHHQSLLRQAGLRPGAGSHRPGRLRLPGHRPHARSRRPWAPSGSTCAPHRRWLPPCWRSPRRGRGAR